MWLKLASGSYPAQRKIPTSVEGYKALLRSTRDLILAKVAPPENLDSLA
jgi:hypothetical protein